MPKTNKYPVGGFTLIEMLVVVLIIGILAAIALPQYKLTTVKAKTSALFPLMKRLIDAEQTYYLTNGNYTGDVSVLDIDMPEGCSHVDFETYESSARLKGEMFACGTHFMLDNSARDNRVTLNYCPNSNDSWENCAPNRAFQISFTGPDSSIPNKRICSVLNGSSLGEKICNIFGELEKY